MNDNRNLDPLAASRDAAARGIAYTVPVIDAIVDGVGSVQGNIAHGGYTDDGRPTISGRGRPGDLVHVYDNDLLLGRVRIPASGEWSLVPVRPLAEGAHEISVTHEDPDGNTSEFSPVYLINVDLHAPERPEIDAVADDQGPDVGPVAHGGTTDDNTPTLTGKADPGDKVTILDNGNVIGETTVGKDGIWSFTPTTPLMDGQHAFEVMVTDPAGNPSETSETYIVVVGTQGPEQIATVTAIGKDWGVSGTDRLTSDGSAGRLMQGVISAPLLTGERLQVSTDGGRSWVDAIVDGRQWAAQDNNSHSGSWEIQTKVVNSAGKAGEVQFKEVVFDTLVPNAPILVATDGAYVRVNFNKADVAEGDIVSIVAGGLRHDYVLTAQEAAAGTARINPGISLAQSNVMAAIVDKAGNASRYLDQGEYHYVDFSGAAAADLMAGQSASHAGIRVTSLFDYNHWQSKQAVNGFSSYDPAIASGMKIGVMGSSRIDFLEGPLTELKFLVTNLQADAFGSAQARFYGANGALVGQLTLSADWPNTLNAAFKAPAGKEFSYMVVSTGYKLPGVKTYCGDYDWIGLDNFEMRRGPGKLNTLSQQTISGTKGTYYGGDEDNIFSLGNIAHLAATTSGGISAGQGIDTLKLTGARQVLDLGEIGQKIDSIEIIDITGSGNNTLRMTLADVLAGGGRNLFTSGGKVQMLVKGNAGDMLELNGTAGGPLQGEWKMSGVVQVGGATYAVYRHSAYDAEVLVQQGVEVRSGLSIDAMGKDTGAAVDFVTADGSAGRLLQGTVISELAAGAKVQVSTDNGKSWGDAIVQNGRWFFTDLSVHASGWNIQARIVGANGMQVQSVERQVTLADGVQAPRIVRIAEAEDVLTATEANNGVDMQVSLAGSKAVVGDVIHVQWGIAVYQQVLTAQDIAADAVLVKVPTAVTRTGTTTGQGVSYDFDVVASIVSQGLKGPASEAYRVIGGGFSSKTLADTLNVAATAVVNDVYDGNGVTVGTFGSAKLAKMASTTATLAGLKLVSPGGDEAGALFTLDGAARRISLRFSGVDNAGGGVQVVVYGVDGKQIHRETLTGTLSSGRYIKAFTYNGAEGGDVGSFKVITSGKGVTMDAFSQVEALHVADARDVHKLDEVSDTYHGSAGNDTITLGYTTATHLASTANKGIHGGDGVDTLKLQGASQAMNLTLATSAGKLSGVEIIDITGTGNNTLTLSLKDVLENGQVGLFGNLAESRQQMLVKGNAGDALRLDDLLGVGGEDLGDWVLGGKQVVNGVSYATYQHSGLDAELLVQELVKVTLI
ncbi:Ig-like domain-containing protein [Stenotrophomonas sp. SY1]|uniref:Ig-like domain-containing protein n=1 Tax=Stenotrophomonas sp. SY1 TaxID=477235 RepID=UPI001E3FDACC|nr:Ig-like domain-containing protein [Stenotrophomonas sp. SY1]MCD9087202.1 Ig-like domain-containing protein [Stenotrophomonas sp. SY1]